MNPPVIWRPRARADLFALYDWIAGQAGGDVAFRYTSAIERTTAELATFPERGTPRPDLGPGMRSIAHRRRTVIAYRVLPDTVEIVALAHGGRELGGGFEEA